MSDEQIVALLLPKACAWAEAQERRILAEGVPLTDDQRVDAIQVGVRHPERVRVLRIGKIPGPEDPQLIAAANAAGMHFTHSAGMALRYGIYLRTGLHDERATLAHELTHTAQFERLGDIQAFFQQYVTECLTAGYDGSALELEAIASAEQVML